MQKFSHLLYKTTMGNILVRRPLNLTLAPSQSRTLLAPCSASSFSSTSYFTTDSGFSNMATVWSSELPQVPKLVEGCDYRHWLVVMDAPKGYPLRDEIVNGYIKTLSMVLGSEEDAKRSIYSVSTKYYYAFGCRVPENLTYRIKYSYLFDVEGSYGGEPFVDGKVVTYDEKYHEDWFRDKKDESGRGTEHARKSRRRMQHLLDIDFGASMLMAIALYCEQKIQAYVLHGYDAGTGRRHFHFQQLF
ncbi:multiple organellar RNA editing factor 7, mitochondrial isoform X3 [Carica papaya]|uniref:multiple organellar RNA editing factor 7, mitochondrial isoform X3 n=1 Tax=Carica papaya TaxID=3649 RepID=UPI000B8CA9B4|nr:multiple organellar RNA editing factor 7, mitochondrial isoform X3 [Carica papaya]